MSKKVKKSRTLINIIGIPLILLCLFFGNTEIKFFPLFSIFICIIMTLGMYEWMRLSNLECVFIKVINFIFILGIFFIFHLSIDVKYLAFLLISHVLLISIFEVVKSSAKPLGNISASILGLIWIGVFIGTLIPIRDIPTDGFRITLMMFLSVWICDTFAFIAGSKFGKRKLIPKISPNKTWVGAMAGFIGSFIIPVVFYLYYPLSGLDKFYEYLVFGFIFGLFGQLGDLAESALKREAQIKDTSNILHLIP
jgi:phosphatidate cytidylyltransferase